MVCGISQCHAKEACGACEMMWVESYEEEAGHNKKEGKVLMMSPDEEWCQRKCHSTKGVPWWKFRLEFGDGI